MIIWLIILGYMLVASFFMGLFTTLQLEQIEFDAVIVFGSLLWPFTILVLIGFGFGLLGISLAKWIEKPK